MADKSKYDVTKMVELILKHNGNVSAVAKAMKCSRQTITNYANEYPAVKTAIQDARENVLDLAESKLATAIRKGAPWAICFYLKTQGKSRGYVERQEHTGAEGGPILVQSMTDEELERIASGSG